MVLMCSTQVVAQPCRLLVAKRAELIITGLVCCVRIGLTVTDKCDVGHGSLWLVFDLF